MPKNKMQGFIFGVIMSYAMAYGMEVYNIAIKEGVNLAAESVWQLPAIWVGTFMKNFPMAFFWNMFAAAPFTHWIFTKIFREKQ